MTDDTLQTIAMKIVSTEVNKALKDTNEQVEGVVKALEGMEQRLGYLGDAVNKVDGDVLVVTERAREAKELLTQLTTMAQKTAQNTDNLYERVKSEIAEVHATGLSDSKAVTAMSHDVERVSTTVKALTTSGHRLGRVLLGAAVALGGAVAWLLVKVASLAQ